MHTLPIPTAGEGRSLTGTQIGEYVVGELIGMGGMGRVYEASQPVIGKRVAIKVLPVERCPDAAAVARFIAEARAVNEIRHRNIVDIFASGALPDGSHYLVMEFLEGEPFDALIANRAPLSPAEALGHIEEVLEALGAAHAAGVVHRDVKPSNVFLVQPQRGRPYVKLLDFGAAKLGAAPQGMTPPSTTSQVIGTPSFMAPEQVLGQPIGPSSDLYAVGGFLFELLTGRELFPAETAFETMRKHTAEAPPVPSALVSTVPPAVDELVAALLRKDPAQRPQSADAVRRWCEAIRLAAPAPTLIFGAPPVKVPNTVPSAPLPAPSKRRPLTVLAVTLCAMGTVALTGLGSRPERVAAPTIAPPPVTPPRPALQVQTVAPEPEPPAPVPDPPPAPPLVAVEAPAPPAPAPIVRRARVSAESALTDEALLTRKTQLEVRLGQREAADGEPDRVVRRLLASIDLGEARDSESRRVAWKRLEEIGRQLDAR